MIDRYGSLSTNTAAYCPSLCRLSLDFLIVHSLLVLTPLLYFILFPHSLSAMFGLLFYSLFVPSGCYQRATLHYIRTFWPEDLPPLFNLWLVENESDKKPLPLLL